LAGVPAIVAVPVPLSANVTPLGREPVSFKEGAGLPVVVTVKVPPTPTVNAAFVALVIKGADPVPVPLTARVCGLFVELSVIVRVAAKGPETSGEKVTLIVQFPLLATDAPQLLVCEKSPPSVPVKSMLVKVTGLPDVLVRITACEVLEVVSAWFPKDRLAGLSPTGSVCRNTETFMSLPLAMARSSAPSPLKSAVATPKAPMPVV